MRTTERIIRNQMGLHGRPAAAFVKLAATFRSTVTLENLTREAAPGNAKSMLTIMKAAVEQGHRVRVTAEGEDEEAAITAIEAAIDAGLGEELPA